MPCDMPYAQPMAKDVTLTIRLETSEREALERAAVADERSASFLARRAIVAMLRDGGWLPRPGELSRREAEGSGE